MSERSNNRGPSFLSLLALLFIGLKLGGVIDWPWWAVLSPLWGAIFVGLVLIVIIVIAAVISDLLERRS